MANESLLFEIPKELLGSVDFLITILQALGWILIFYILFNVINTIILGKRNKNMKSLEDKIDKTNSLLKDIKKLLSDKKKGKKK